MWRDTYRQSAVEGLSKEFERGWDWISPVLLMELEPLVGIEIENLLIPNYRYSQVLTNWLSSTQYRVYVHLNPSSPFWHAGKMTGTMKFWYEVVA